MTSVKSDSAAIFVRKSKCKFCEGEAKYTCPRCNCCYCSVKCYKCKQHMQCSEEFYKDWIITSLKNDEICNDSKKKMLETLRKLHNEEEEEEDDDLDYKINFIENCNNIKEEELWAQLTESEKERFRDFINSEEVENILPVWIPWWTKKEPKVQELCNRNQIQMPNIKPLSLLTSRVPSECVKYNLTNVIYAYVYVAKKYNGDYHEFYEEAAHAFLYLAPVLYSNINFNSAGEAVHYCIQKLCAQNGEFSLVREAAIELLKEVSLIFESTDACIPEKSVIYSLFEIVTLFERMRKYTKQHQDEDDILIEKNKLKKSIMKLEYFMSWTVEYKECFSQLISELEMEYLCAVENTLPNIKLNRVKKVLIEEI